MTLGSPLAQVYANLFIGYRELYWLIQQEALSVYELKIKEAHYIKWSDRNLNK